MSRYTHLAAVTAGVALAACTDAPHPLASTPPVAAVAARVTGTGSGSGTYIIRAHSDVLPDGLADAVREAGGEVTRAFRDLGIAVATSSQSDFAAHAARLAGVASVIPDFQIRSVPDSREPLGFDGLAHTGSVNTHDEPFFPVQWALDAIDAPEAWALGATGQGVRVAVLDWGFDLTHPDLNDNFDLAAARSFVPGHPLSDDPGSHGTFLSGIIAAEDNGIGILGVAPRATVIPVKALHDGFGEFSWGMEAIYYAATPITEGGAGADVINMSFGGVLTPEEQKLYREEIRELITRSLQYAWQRGVTLVGSAGNAAVNFDDEGRHFLHLPSGDPRVIAVAATAPVGWALGNRDFARPTSYTNAGKALIDLAAPGGGFDLPHSDPPESCTVGIVSAPCVFFDLVLSTFGDGYDFWAGTSMSAPHVAGVAALVIGQSGGKMHPAEVGAALRQGALDLGKPGHDEVYGHGFLNAYGAVVRAH